MIPSGFAAQFMRAPCPKTFCVYDAGRSCRARRRSLRFSSRSASPACRKFASAIVQVPERGDRQASSRSLNDDMPFLVDSVLAELNERALRRAPGRASGLRRRARRERAAPDVARRCERPGAHRESFIHIHLAPVDDAARRASMIGRACDRARAGAPRGSGLAADAGARR